MRFELEPRHVFQRRFDSEALAEALHDCHLYIISRRDAVRIIRDSVEVYPDRITFAAAIGFDGSAGHERFGLQFDESYRVSDFRLHAEGGYFSFRTGHQMWHGDAWALTSMAAKASPAIAGQEVLYIGKAFGEEGKSNVHTRTRRHEKLQRIYEDHVGGPDIFVTALRVVRASVYPTDHIADSEKFRIAKARKCIGTFVPADDNRIPGPAIDLIEHALVAHFVPPYNEALTEWRPDRPTKAMRSAAGTGVRLIEVAFNAAGCPARFYSRHVAEPTISHLIIHDLPTRRRPEVLRGISAVDVAPQWLQEFASRCRALSAGTDELPFVALRVFGPRAPRVRKPAAVDLHDDIYERMARLKADLADMPGTIHYDGEQFYDPELRQLRVGRCADGTPISWQLYDGQGRARHVTIFGPAGWGKSNLMRVLHVGMMQSRGILLWVIDGSQRNIEYMRFLARRRLVDWLAVDKSEALLILSAAVAIATDRLTRERNADEVSIAITIDDAEELLSQPRARELVEKLALVGPDADVRLVLCLPDENLARFGGSRALRRTLAQHDACFLGEEDALLTMEEFRSFGAN
ncbi:P-loop NTPase family protein [Micromonospora wenchangensis]|uniref:hypothetical protein n=1 Tax=Micromonospora wenchangensis TaxID=1185415 RepID=UPI0038207D2A